MRRLTPLLALVVAACSGAPSLDPPDTTIAIVGATVIHPDRDGAAAVERDATIVVERNRIKSVGTGVTPPAQARVIEAKGKWVIPGLIDSHVHFFQSGNLYTRPDVADFNAVVPYAKEVARNRARLPATFKVWIASGVTSVVDVGGPFWNFEVRDAARRTAAAPRVQTTGPLISMIDRPKLDLGDPPIVKVTTPDQARALVQRELEHKPDFIKVWFIHQPGDDLAAQEAIVKATAEAAHAAGVRLAVHATELVVAKSALRAGADFLVHSVEDEPVDDEFLRLARDRKALYCPTLFVYAGYGLALSGRWKPTLAEQRLADPEIVAAMDDLRKMPKEQLPEGVARRMAKSEDEILAAARSQRSVAMKNLRVVWDAGIPVVMGTDAGNIGTLHGPSVFREMSVMAEAGLTPLQVLRSATVGGARTLGLDSDLGDIAPGKLADLVILDGDPLADVDNLSKVATVIRDGRVFDPAELMLSVRPE